MLSPGLTETAVVNAHIKPHRAAKQFDQSARIQLEKLVTFVVSKWVDSRYLLA